MGKDRKKANRAFITQKEWSLYYGGLKKRSEAAAAVVVPFDCCALTLVPFKTPVCTREGIVYELSAVEGFVRRYGVDPATGQRLGREGLTVLHFHRNAAGRYHCPVLYKEFTAYTKIAAVRTTGNVYSYEAIAELNLRAGNMRDLLDGTPFAREDVIVLQDPEHPERRDVGGFYYYRVMRGEEEGRDGGEEGEERGGGGKDGKAAAGEGKRRGSGRGGMIVGSRATEKVLREYHAREQAATAENNAIMGPSSTPTAANSGSGSGSSSSSSHEGGAKEEEERLYDHRSASGAQRVDGSAPGFTSSVFSAGRAKERGAPAVGKETRRRGYVGLETSMGTLNVEVRSDAAPLASENFLELCERGYYDGVCFHRNVPGFVVQGGDPTGTGRGGESVWGHGFRVEQSGLRHDGAGVLGMANAGPGTNGSQFYVTYAAQPGLDGRHTVFGRVVGGMEVLRLMERVATDPATERPLAPITIRRAVVYVNPFRELELERRAAERAAAAARQAEEERWDASTCGTWYSNPTPSPAAAAAASKTSSTTTSTATTAAGSKDGKKSKNTTVGKYIRTTTTTTAAVAAATVDNRNNSVSKKKRMEEGEEEESVEDYLSRPISFSYEDEPETKKPRK